MKLFKKVNKRDSLYKPQRYDSEAYKVENQISFEHSDSSWTCLNYEIPEEFSQFYYLHFDKISDEMLDTADEGVPNYMDQIIEDETEMALTKLIRFHASKPETIGEIITRKEVSLSCIERELKEIRAEKEKLQAIIEKIGGNEYE